ncbi:MAG TPA: transcriptional repressor [Thermoplasmata archaeon]|nr:transcriptional repressor [Thermoplasmata archaeon]
MEKYIELLKKNQLKITHQRLEILKYLDENRIHPTAEEIYTALKVSNPSLSKTTVYNTIEVLLKHGIIQALTITAGEKRYDFKTRHHHHFLCRVCGAIIDLDVECPYLESFFEGEHKIEEVHGYFKGVCKKCLKKQSLENNGGE